jgi:hypothetical protein
MPRTQQQRWTEEARQRVSERFRGARNHNWKGGISKARDVLKASPEYKAWAATVYRLDRFMCQLCDTKCKKPDAHHIKPVRDFPHLVFDLENGVTLCRTCHRRTYGKEHEFAALFAARVAKRVKSVNARPDGAEGNTEPSRGGNASEGVETRGRAFPIDLSQFDKQDVPCASCGTMLRRHPYRVRTQKRHFCSRTCKGEWQRVGYKGQGAKRVQVRCSWCGVAIERRPCEAKYNAHYCTQSCMGSAWASRRWHGGNTPTSALPERDEIVRATA